MSQSSKDNTLYIDKLDALYKSDIWNLIKARLIYLQARLESDALTKLQVNGSSESVAMISAKAVGVKLAIEVSEGLAGELEKDSFDADEAWVVIENILSVKGKKGIKPSWIRQILAKIINKK